VGQVIVFRGLPKNHRPHPKESFSMKIADVRRTYRLHPDGDRENQWMGPMEELPPGLG